MDDAASEGYFLESLLSAISMDSISVALRAVRLQNWMSIFALFSVFVVPVLFGVGFQRLASGRAIWQQITLGLSAILTSLLYVGAAFVFAVCWGGEIGESGKNRLARAYGAPVVSALAAYKTETGDYPRDLRDLVPVYLTPTALRAPEDGPLKYPFEYSRDSSGFQLVVRYVGPGMNTCRYSPGQRWACGGYF